VVSKVLHLDLTLTKVVGVYLAVQVHSKQDLRNRPALAVIKCSSNLVRDYSELQALAGQEDSLDKIHRTSQEALVVSSVKINHKEEIYLEEVHLNNSLT
jgi:hypothetical protein